MPHLKYAMGDDMAFYLSRYLKSATGDDVALYLPKHLKPHWVMMWHSVCRNILKSRWVMMWHTICCDILNSCLVMTYHSIRSWHLFVATISCWRPFFSCDSLIMFCRCSYEEIDPQLPVAPESLPSSYGLEPLIFIGTEGLVALKRGIQRNHLLNGYGHFTIPPLPPCDHPSKWMESRTKDLTDFQGKGISCTWVP